LRILAGTRQSGKTTKLIEAAKATNGYILVANQMMYEHCVNIGMPRDRILRIRDFKNGNLRGRTLNGPLYVDNLEVVFQAIMNEFSSGKFPTQIAAATISLTQDEIDLMFNKFVVEDIIIDPPK